MFLEDLLVYHIRVPFKGLNGLIHAKPANVNALVDRARSKSLISLPGSIHHSSWMEGKLLLVLASLRVPNYGCTITAWKMFHLNLDLYWSSSKPAAQLGQN